MFQAACLAIALMAPPVPPPQGAVGIPAPPPLLDAPTAFGARLRSNAGVVSSDKAAHVLGGFWSAAAGYAFATHHRWDPSDRRTAALAAAATASVAKEAFDAWIQDESFSAGDLLADGVGAAAFLAIAFLAGP